MIITLCFYYCWINSCLGEICHLNPTQGGNRQYHNNTNWLWLFFSPLIIHAKLLTCTHPVQGT